MNGYFEYTIPRVFMVTIQNFNGHQFDLRVLAQTADEAAFLSKRGGWTTLAIQEVK